MIHVVETDVHGGAEVYVERLAAHTGGEVAALGRTLPGPKGKADVLGLLRLAWALRRHDLVHVNANEPANARYAMAAARLARVPYVVTLHTPGTMRGTLVALYRRAAAVIAVSQEIAGILAAAGIDAEVIPNGVPLPEPVVPTGERRVVGTLGRLVPEKGIDVLLAATRDLDVEVRIGGDGPLREELERDARATFAGRVDAEEFLRGLDVFVLASRTEGLPFALLEAMALGLPCVATSVGDVPEALRGAGALVPPDDVDALREAIRTVDPALGAKARQRVEERYSESVMLGATGAVFSRARRRRRAARAPRSGR